MSNRTVRYGHIWLPYFKQGDDFASAKVLKEDGTVDVHKSIENHIGSLEHAIEILKEIRDIVPNNGEITMDGDTHHIGINGKAEIIERLVDRKLAMIDEFLEEEEESEEKMDDEEADEEIDEEKEGKMKSLSESLL